MVRQCTIIKTSEIFANRHICIDIQNADEISEVLFQNEKYAEKFEYITGRILEQANIYYDDYRRIENDSGIRVSEMRFFPNGDNCRVYCREITLQGNMFCIIMAKLLPKKKPSGKIDKAIKQIINSIKDYEYEIIR